MKFTQKLKSHLKRFSQLVSLKRKMWRFFQRKIWIYFDGSRGKTNLDILAAFPLYIPSSLGKYKARSALTIQAINQLPVFLSALSASTNNKRLEITDVRDFPQSSEDIDAANALKTLFDRYGSDKANLHNYHYIYGSILKNKGDIKNIFEIGLGTNNTDVVSTMGASGKPGASLRAFRVFLPKAKIYGADVDKRVLFKEDRIETFYVDQTDPGSFEQLASVLPDNIDLIIDDGLHSPNANIQTLNFAITKIRVGGWIVIEDINANSIPAWEVVAALLPSQFETRLIKTNLAMVFIVRKLS